MNSDKRFLKPKKGGKESFIPFEIIIIFVPKFKN